MVRDYNIKLTNVKIVIIDIKESMNMIGGWGTGPGKPGIDFPILVTIDNSEPDEKVNNIIIMEYYRKM